MALLFVEGADDFVVLGIRENRSEQLAVELMTRAMHAEVTLKREAREVCGKKHTSAERRSLFENEIFPSQGRFRCSNAVRVAIRPREVVAESLLESRTARRRLRAYRALHRVLSKGFRCPQGHHQIFDDRKEQAAIHQIQATIVDFKELLSAARADSRLICALPPDLAAFTCTKSRTRLSSRFTIRGVPRERLAISLQPDSSIESFSNSAERRMIFSSSFTG
ncbi:unnamed protein product [Sphagnum jensenii]|uniref:Uncharacterized protein n=1 Tax=Sphagnum jensenii TaxID=128206 RepID=A0ABP0V7H5_9BRYO